MPEKAKSKSQARFLGAVAGGAIKKKGLSPEKAGEMVRGTKMSNLPEKKKTSDKAKFDNARKRYYGLK